MDLSGSLQGAGGVGGLLAVDETSATYYPTYDGNGNVSDYLNASGGIEAHYEYDAFGNTTTSVGAKSGDFRHRFSTKPLDAETGFYYYGYRYYDPVTGRWPSRDPIEEEGRINLYAFVGNDAVNKWDLFGMKPCSEYDKVRDCKACGDGTKEGRTKEQGEEPGEGNGCGAEGGISFSDNPGRANFKPCCNEHDKCYATCGADKDKCDQDFRKCMRKACATVYERWNIPGRAACYIVAHSYYVAVKNGGGGAYERAQDKHCKWECCE
ncbi:MAG: RHS repeat-associated core domain-containing protein [Verrucomicrobiota bacterium JB023]|nr:RHS repeat-associated core domain-containing protein [Verrucomicrobiota bacterium JB023]